MRHDSDQPGDTGDQDAAESPVGDVVGRRRVVMLHGFGQTGRCLGPVAGQLSEDHKVLTPDLPGHATRSHMADMDCTTAAQHLADTHGAGVWIGYSMGGRMALHVGLRRPEVVRSLVLIGATAGISDPAERARRRQLDETRARELQELGVERFMHRWLQMEMFQDLGADARFQDERCRNSVEGLSGSLRNAGTGAMEPLWARLDELAMPVLVISGGNDPTYGELAARMVSAIGENATAIVIPGAGHAVHLEAPTAVRSALHTHLGI